MRLKLPSGCFYGELSKRCDVAGLKLTEIIYPPEHKTVNHSHERAYLSLTLEGTYTKRYKTQVVKCIPSTLIFHPSNEAQSGYCDETGGRSFIIELEPQVLNRLPMHPITAERLAVFRGGPLTWLATKLYKEFRLMDELSSLAIEGIGLELLAKVSRHNVNTFHRNPPYWLKQAKELLHSSFSQNLTLAGIARLVGVHPVYLASEFRRFYGTTVGGYVRRLRVDFACRMLSVAEDSILEIALAAGFSSQSHFSTTFKRLIGMSPTEYRATFRSP
jgi:AraC family transcriptional regulator